MSTDNATDNGWAKGFGAAPARQGGSYIAPGVYDVTITKIAKHTGRNPTKNLGQVSVIIEATIDRVVTAFDADPGDAKGGWPASNRAGEKVSSHNNFTKQGETAQSNVKAVLLACIGVKAIAAGRKPPTERDLTPEQWEEQLAQAVAGAGTQWSGTRLRVWATKTRKKDGGPFTPLRWEPIPAEPAPA